MLAEQFLLLRLQALDGAIVLSVTLSKAAILDLGLVEKKKIENRPRQILLIYETRLLLQIAAAILRFAGEIGLDVLLLSLEASFVGFQSGEPGGSFLVQICLSAMALGRSHGRTLTRHFGGYGNNHG